MIGLRDEACVLGLRDARSGRFDPPRGRTAEDAYRRAWKRETKRMRDLGALAQLELWERALIETL